MRISSAYRYDQFRDAAGANLERLQTAQTRVGTGRKFEHMAESPLAGRVVLDSQRLLARTSQYASNLGGAKATLASMEGVLGEIGDLMNQARVNAVRGANGTLEQEGREALADQVRSLRARLVSLANSQGVSGDYLFAGTKTDSKPFEAQEDALTYRGDSGVRRVEVNSGEYRSTSLDQAQALVRDSFQTLTDLENDLRSGDLESVGGEDLAGLEQLRGAWSLARGDVGARLQDIEQLSTTHTRRIDDLTERISDSRDVDLTEAILELTQAQTAYSASLQASAQVMNLSLLDFMR